jgi:hypothetical protein
MARAGFVIFTACSGLPNMPIVPTALSTLSKKVFFEMARRGNLPWRSGFYGRFAVIFIFMLTGPKNGWISKRR